jgi:sporulation protein YlmC with PRC-barrel domain
VILQNKTGMFLVAASLLALGLTGARAQDAQTGADSGQAQADAAQTTIVTYEVPIVPLDTWDPAPLQSGVSVRSLMDADVNNVRGEDVAVIESVVMNADGRVLGVVVEGGGFLDIGDTELFVPWSDVTLGAEPGEVQIPVISDEADELVRYSLFNDEQLPAPVNGQRAWRATELIGDYVRLKDGRGYGYVRDIIVGRDGAPQAVIVVPDVRYGRGGYYAYPYYGTYAAGWTPGLDYYGLPYSMDEVSGLDPFDYGRFVVRN